jgi:hypothetical protein
VIDELLDVARVEVSISEPPDDLAHTVARCHCAQFVYCYDDVDAGRLASTPLHIHELCIELTELLQNTRRVGPLSQSGASVSSQLPA